MRRSLRFRLTVAIVGVLTVLFVCLSLVLHAGFSRALYRQFDGRLLDDAAAVAGMAEDESPMVEFESESLPEFERGRRPSYFEAWLDDGRVLARSPSLGDRDLPRQSKQAGPVFADIALPDERAGRRGPTAAAAANRGSDAGRRKTPACLGPVRDRGRGPGNGGAGPRHWRSFGGGCSA